MVRLGVHVTDRVIAGSVNPGPPSSRALMVGVTERGPINSRGVVVNSLAQFINLFGGDADFAQSMYYGAAQFFSAGGAELVPVRVVGPGAQNGSINLQDTAGLDTIRIDTRDPGPHSGQYEVVVESDADAGTFSVVVVDQDGNILDRFLNLTTPQDLVSQAILATSVRVTDLGSATAAPGNVPAEGRFTMSTGSDDRGNITVQSYIDALTAAGDVAPGGVIFAPGKPGDVYGQALLDHAKRTKALAYLSAGSGTSRSGAVAAARACAALANADYGVFLHSEVAAPDRLNSRAFWTTPEATIAGRRAAVHAAFGFYRSPVGETSRVESFIRGTKDDVDRLAAEVLADDKINALVTTRGTQTRVNLLSYRTLAKDQNNLGSAQHRDTLNNIAVQADYALQEFLGRPIDGRSALESVISGRLEGMLQPLVDAGVLYARPEDGTGTGDPGYAIAVEQMPATYQGSNWGAIRVSLRVRLSYDAELIEVEIIKHDPTAAL